MSIRTVDQIGDWESVPFAGGYEGLHSLADDEFSGVVVSGPSQLFMLKGTVVGILEGTVEDFDSGDGTAREAPHEALPLLAVMQARADEVRGQYYTQDTPIADVDSTLSDGKFTGFVELSENVLSGDYFVVYHQGRSMSVAWVGSSQRLITDDEAFEQANDEVGIYEVKPVEIEPVEIPEPTVDESSEPERSIDDETLDDDSTADSGVETVRESEADDSQEESLEEHDAETGTDDRRGPAMGGPPGSKAAGASQRPSIRDDDSQRTQTETINTASDTRADDSESPSDRNERDDTTNRAAHSDTEQPQSVAKESATDAAPESRATDSPAPQQPDRIPERNAQTSPSQQRDESAERHSESPETAAGATNTSVTNLETRSIPSLDPERSISSPDMMSSDTDSRGSRDRERRPDSAQKQPSTSEQTKSETRSSGQAGTSVDETISTREQGEDAAVRQSDSESIAVLEDELEEREAELADLEAERDELATEADGLRTERDRLQSELDDARTEIERLEARLEEAEGPGSAAETNLTANEAIGKTNLFVRYHSKGEATLTEVHDGKATRSDVEENLRLEYHTQFEASDATVDGTPFEEFLHETLQYRFVNWLVRDLLYEIETTGHTSSMADLFDAIPRIDRAELDGKVSVEYTENGEHHRSQEQFDIVVRDRMGNPLVVANINDSREPASDEQMSGLVRNGERVGNASETLAGAFLVTSSFFAPEALETAKEATSSGLLSRDKRQSYVNLSRKDGFHLCLLEARNNEFHLAVPEL